MSKTILSPVGKFSGRVVLSDPLTMPQVMAFEDGMQEARVMDEGKGVLTARRLHTILSAVIPCVEKWELAGLPEVVTPDTFPGTPKMAVAKLIAWIVEEITKLYNEADEIPNA